MDPKWVLKLTAREGGTAERPDSIPEVPPEVITSAEAPPEVPPELITAVLSRLPPNEVALSARRTCRAAAQHFAEEHHRTAAIGQPLPPHAASGPLEEAAEGAFRGLTFTNKLRTLSVAAASGSVANLEAAWRLLQPCLFPALLQTTFYLQRLPEVDDPGTAAAKRGHISALAWLLARCPGLVDCSRTLVAAAEHCPLPQLQEAWGLLSAADSSLRLDDAVLGAAAESAMPNGAVAKMKWLLQQGECSLTVGTAAAAARCGDLARLRWLRERGCPFDSREVLGAALANADLSVVAWLVDEAGCPLPAGAGPQDAGASAAFVTAAAASGNVAKLRWLQARGVELLPALTGGPWAMQAAAQSGSLAAVKFLHGLGGDGVLSARVIAAAAASGSLDVAAYLLNAGCPVHDRTWTRVGLVGDVAMARWLVEAAHLPVDDVPVWDDVLRMWPEWRAAQRRQLLEVVRLVAPPGGSADERMQRCAMHHAACRGHVGLMRYLHEELGAELRPEVLVDAADGGCEATIGWLVERGCGAGAAEQLDGCYVNAAANGDLAALACLRRLGVPWSEGLLVKAVRQREVPLPVVQWLWGQGARVGRRELEHARRGLLDEEYERRAPMSDEKRQVVEWLRGQLAMQEREE